MADVKENAREAIAVWTDKRVEDIDVTVTVVVPTVVQTALDEAQRLQKEASERLERSTRYSTSHHRSRRGPRTGA